MKHIITLSLALLLGQFFYTQPAPKTISTVSETYVYVCTGGSSKRYHKISQCGGLKTAARSSKGLPSLTQRKP